MMKISFMTLGCPDWDLDTICRRGEAYGFDGVDFRGLQDEIDVTKLPAFTTGVSETRQKLKNAGLEVSGISSSIRVCVAQNLASNLEEAKRTIEVAHALDARNVRVFGMGNLDDYTRTELARIGCDCINRILALDEATTLNWLFETHDNWIRAQDCKLLLDEIASPAFGALWDMGHTARVGGESPAESYAAIGQRVGYTHVKDAIYDPSHPEAMADGWRYVLPGQGQLPLAEAIALLNEKGYDGWLLFEHEKRWHPELAAPEVAFPAFVSWVRPLLQSLST
ncbi:MAG: sugar phosphate isomerase/epimerase [Chloroflexota bacterium]|nr:sugar phosphate isomerase/epimerase [Chloroflexota bacterium]